MFAKYAARNTGKGEMFHQESGALVLSALSLLYERMRTSTA